MLGTLAAVHLAGLVGTLLFTVLVGVAVWRRRDRPGGQWFARLVVVDILWVGSYTLGLLLPSSGLRVWFEVVSFGFSAVVPVLWAAFVLQYTGSGHLVTRRTVAGASVVPAISTVLFVTNGLGLHALAWRGTTVHATAGLTTVELQYGPWLPVQVVHTYALVGISLVAAGRVLLDHEPFTDQSLALVVGTSLPLVGSVVAVAVSLPIPGLRLTPVVLGLTNLTYAYALYRQDLLEFLPAARIAGQRTIVAELEDGVVTVDDRGRIVDCNRAATSIVGDDPAAVTGDPFDAVFPVDTPAPIDDPVEYSPAGEATVYEIAPSGVDAAGGAIGQVLVFRDVTHRKRREQRLTVLNRVLRHNVRNDMNVVSGYARQLQGELDGNLAGMAGSIAETADNLANLGTKARSFGAVLDPEEAADSGRIDVVPLLTELAADVARDNPEATVETDLPPAMTIELTSSPLTAVVEEALRNAVEHGGDVPCVRLRARVDDGDAVVTVTDDGPGIPHSELDAIERGRETDLEHASGVGLWLIAWGASTMGGEATFDTGHDGTAVTVRLPSERVDAAILAATAPPEETNRETDEDADRGRA